MTRVQDRVVRQPYRGGHTVRINLTKNQLHLPDSHNTPRTPQLKRDKIHVPRSRLGVSDRDPTPLRPRTVFISAAGRTDRDGRPQVRVAHLHHAGCEIRVRTPYKRGRELREPYLALRWLEIVAGVAELYISDARLCLRSSSTQNLRFLLISLIFDTTELLLCQLHSR